jgi:hypothetical protein
MSEDPPGSKPEASASSQPQPPELESALRKISDRPQVLQEIMMGFGSMGNPIHHKMTSEHIGQVLDLAVKHDERQFTLAQQSNNNDALQQTSTRKYAFWAFVLVVGFAAALLYTFKGKPELLLPMLTGFGGFLTGAAAGFGIGRSKSK